MIAFQSHFISLFIQRFWKVNKSSLWVFCFEIQFFNEAPKLFIFTGNKSWLTVVIAVLAKDINIEKIAK